MQVMSKAFTDIDYKNLDTGRNLERPLVYDESSPQNKAQESSTNEVLLTLISDFDEEKGWQKCPEGTSTSGVGEPNFYLWNEGGGYIICYLDEELHPKEDRVQNMN